MNALASSASAMTTTTSNWSRPMPPEAVVAAPGWALVSEGVRRLAADDNCSRRAGTWLALVRYGTLGGSALGCMPARLVGSSWTLSLPVLCWRVAGELGSTRYDGERLLGSIRTRRGEMLGKVGIRGQQEGWVGAARKHCWIRLGTVRGKNESKTRRRCHRHLIITTTKMCTSPSTVFPVQRNHAVSCDTMNTYTSLKVHCI